MITFKKTLRGIGYFFVGFMAIGAALTIFESDENRAARMAAEQKRTAEVAAANEKYEKEERIRKEKEEREFELSQRPTLARGRCQRAIKPYLHDPSSADWGMFSDTNNMYWPYIVEDEIYTVYASFRAKNPFGAMVMVNMVCVFDAENKQMLELREI